MKRIKKFFKTLGPGFITGASNDDPAGIATYSQTGARFGFSLLWLSIFQLPLAISVQEMCGKIGLITGKGLAGVIKQHYSKKILYIAVLLLFIANTVNIGANLGAMAASAELVLPIPFEIWLLLMVTITLIMEIFVSYRLYAKYLKYLAFVLISYVITAFIVGPDWKKVFLSTFFPHIEVSKEFMVNVVAIFGTTISPYLFFWQASEEVEEEVVHHKLTQYGMGKPLVTTNDVKKLDVDTISGMFFAGAIMWFIIIVTGTTLFPHGIHTIDSAHEAALALKPFAGEFAFLLFAIGIIGTGLLSVPILAGSASYAISEAFGWKEGLSQKLRKAHGFYGAITVATLLGLSINFIGINPIQALYFSAVINGIIAPILLILILLIANNKSIMGEYTNGKMLNFWGIVAVITMASAVIGMLLLF